MRPSTAAFGVLLLASAASGGPKRPAPDPGFGARGTAVLRTSDTPYEESVDAVAQDRLGRVLVAVYRYSLQEAPSGAVLLRLDPRGVLDQSFGTNGVLDLTDVITTRAIGVDSQGRVVLAGSSPYDSFSGVQDVRLVRLAEDGGFDSSFGTDGVATLDVMGTDSADSLVIDPQDRPVVGVNSYHLVGSFENLYEGRVLRFTTDGMPDPTFGGDGIADLAALPRDIAGLALDGARPVYCGRDEQVTYHEFQIGRVLEDGTPDPAFADAGRLRFENSDLLIGELSGIGVDASHRVVVAGEHDASFETADDAVLLRFTPAGALDPTFDGDGALYLDPSRGGYDQRLFLRIADEGRGAYVLAGELTTRQRNAAGWFLLEQPQAGGPARTLRRPMHDSVGDTSPGALAVTRDGAALFAGGLERGGSEHGYDVLVSRILLTPSGPADLAVQWSAHPTQKLKRDGRASLKGVVTVSNRGGTAAPSVGIRFYLSDDAALDASDTLLVEVPSGALKPLASKKRSLRATPPASAAGRRVIAVVDEGDSVPEKDETNGVSASEAIE
jgi:uncharacterized delta-60 repeat protein